MIIALNFFFLLIAHAVIETNVLRRTNEAAEGNK
jgi:hypothetical protein